MIKRYNNESLIDMNAFSNFFITFKELADREKKKFLEETKE